MQLTRSGESRLHICCTRIHSLGLSETIGTQEDPLIRTACRHWLRGNLRPLQAATAPESCDALAFAKLVPAERRIQSIFPVVASATLCTASEGWPEAKGLVLVLKALI